MRSEQRIPLSVIWADWIRQDVRYAVRSLIRSPGFAVTAILALALGIGAGTAIFSVVDVVLLRPVPYPSPDSLLSFVNLSPGGSGPRISPTKFNLWRRDARTVELISAHRRKFVNLTGASPEQVLSAQVSGDFFRLFGVSPAQGRLFGADEDQPNGPKVAIISYGFWKRRLNQDPCVIGRTLPLSGAPYVVVGVLQAGFNTEDLGGAIPIDIWTPLQLDPNATDQASFLDGAARLRPGVSLAGANSEIASIAEAFRRVYPTAIGPKDSFGLRPMLDVLVGNVKTSLWVLLGAVGFVLLIACTNVANVLVVRAESRKHEIAIRAAAGASRARILRQLLTESAVLWMVGGILGLLLGVLGLQVLLIIDSGLPRIGTAASGIGLNWRVMGFAGALSMITGICFGLIPALQGSRSDLSVALQESGGRSGTGARQTVTRSVLVVAEVSLALTLVVGAALLMRTFVALYAVESGFDSDNVLVLRMALTSPQFNKTSGFDHFVRNGVERINALPGVTAVGVAAFLPLEGGYVFRFIIDGRPLDGAFHGRAHWKVISPGYFPVFKIPVVKGRAFNDNDDGNSPPVAIISQAMARQFWPSTDPMKDRLIIGKGVSLAFNGEPARQIVGIVGDVRDDGLNQKPFPEIYVPASQLPDGLTALNVAGAATTWAVRTQVAPHSLAPAVQNELYQASGGIPVSGVRSMKELISRSTARQHFNMLLLSIFAGVAVLLAAIGIYGLLAYSVSLRRREIAIRMALGANASQVRNQLLKHGMALTLTGIAIGLATAFGVTPFIETFLFGVKPHDPFVFVAAPLFMCLVALIAIWFPAARAARISPVTALKEF